MYTPARPRTGKLACALLLAAGLLLAGGLPAAEDTRDDPGDNLQQIIEDYWNFRLEENPLLASRLGRKEAAGKLPAIAPADHRRRQEQQRRFLQRLRALEQGELTEPQRLNRAVLGFILRHEIALARYQRWRMPILSDSGFHTSINAMARSGDFSSLEDYRNYLARLRALPAWLDQHLSNMRQGIEDGFTQPRVILDNMKPSFEAQARDDFELHPLMRPFARLPGKLTGEQAGDIERQARKLFDEQVQPAFKKVHNFFVQEYIPAARETLGASALPEGKAYYQALIRYFTTRDDLDAAAIHQIGLDEVKRIRAEMQQIIDELEFDGDFAAFIDFLRNDPRFYVDSAEQLLKEASWIAKRIDGQLPALFGTLPRQPYGVEPVPEHLAPNYTTGRYSGSPSNSSRGGYYWVNTHALDKRPLYNLPALTLHEAVPGHHLHAALRQENGAIPEFRRRFYPHAFGEGWALYAEKLGLEMEDIYRTPHEHFGRLSYEMWRACRLVIDTGIHAMGWTREQARDYLANNTALSLLNVRTEVDRYISWPGQALAYKIGELTILELRRQAEEALGQQFDLRAFHDAVLADGGLPMDLLRRRIEAFIAEQQQS